MILLPYERFTFQTRFTPDQVRQKLSDQMKEAGARLSWIPVTMNKAKGNMIEEYRFKTSPSNFIKRYRSTIMGKVSHNVGITKIEVTLLPAANVLFFTMLTFAFFGFIWFLLLREWIVSIGTPDVFFPKHVLGIGGALIVGYAIFLGAIKFEAWAIKDTLKSIFDVTE